LLEPALPVAESVRTFARLFAQGFLSWRQTQQ